MFTKIQRVISQLLFRALKFLTFCSTVSPRFVRFINIILLSKAR